MAVLQYIPKLVLDSDTTLYVRIDGSNSNDGLTNTSGGAFATPQGAMEYISRKIDQRGYAINLQMGDGTYDGVSVVDANFFVNLRFTGPINVLGNAGDTDAVIIQLNATTATTTCWQVYGYDISFRNVCFDAENISYAKCIHALSGGTVALYGDIHFKNYKYASIVTNGIDTYVSAYDPTNFYHTATSPQAIYKIYGGTFDCGPALDAYPTTNVTTAFIELANNAFAYWYPTAFTGTITGKRWDLSNFSILRCYGTTLPGNTGGTTSASTFSVKVD